LIPAQKIPDVLRQTLGGGGLEESLRADGSQGAQPSSWGRGSSTATEAVPTWGFHGWQPVFNLTFFTGAEAVNMEKYGNF
jgi:hypothetical protein